MARALDRHEQLSAIADPRRLGILRMLMHAPATLSQIGERLGKHPAWVRHHVQILARAGLIELTEERTTRNYTEKYYAAAAGAFELHLLIAPESSEPTTLIALGSHDLGLEMVGREVGKSHVGMVSVPVGSLDGLIALRQGLCDVAGCHLFDDRLEEYNIPFLRHLFPDMPVIAITLAYREQGLMTAERNPLRLRGVTDLARPGIRLANRNAGSGTRVWLDARLRKHAVDTAAVTGYETAYATHTAVAAAIAEGRADAGIGLKASAEEFGLSFQPLFTERYDLVVRRDRVDDDSIQALLESLSSRSIRRSIGALSGYDTAHTGEEAPTGA
jgi:putative molybdopterin biosynthesis protein